MPGALTTSAILFGAHVAIQVGLVVRVLLRPNRDPASRIAWIVVIVAAPIVGIIAYAFLGETSIGRSRVRRLREVSARLPLFAETPGLEAPALAAQLSARHAHLFRVVRSINGFDAVGGNSARLMEDSHATIASMVEEIDRARDHVHLAFYIWLTDGSGRRMAEALQRAARRGVVCRAMADGLGSRDLIRSPLWTEMRDAGVRLATALPLAGLIPRPLHGRIDLRNHRKILIIDDRVTYCGSQNCADPEFRVKAKYAPWVDIMLRFEGPVARQNQVLFAEDWMTQVDDDIEEILRRPLPDFTSGFPAAAFGTGPTVRHSAMPEMFETLMHAARDELVVTTPYYVPTESLQDALCATAYRGVETTIVFPARNDSWVVAAASRSYYADLLDAGVRIFEYAGGLLHAKTMTLDGEVALVGSANMDRRSFELNYENNILLVEREVTGAIRKRQEHWVASSAPVSREVVEGWSASRRLANNAVAMLGPVL